MLSVEKLFHVKEAGSTVRTEILAGTTTFMTMAYILMVNSSIFAELPGGGYRITRSISRQRSPPVSERC